MAKAIDEFQIMPNEVDSLGIIAHQERISVNLTTIEDSPHL